jgi:hypothetical protein
MFAFEKSKFMTPKYSTCFADLIEFLNIEVSCDDELSDTFSTISRTFSVKKGMSDLETELFKSRAVLQFKRNFIETHNKLNCTVSPIETIVESSDPKPIASTVGLRP